TNSRRFTWLSPGRAASYGPIENPDRARPASHEFGTPGGGIIGRSPVRRSLCGRLSISSCPQLAGQYDAAVEMAAWDVPSCGSFARGWSARMKTILVPTEQSTSMVSALDTALLLGRKFDSYIEGFPLRPAVAELVAMDPDSGLTMVAVKENDAE